VTDEGFVDFRGHKTWYRVAGDLDWPQTPILTLHGGPGGGSDFFVPLEELATRGRPVVRYDQLGCGRSDRPNDPKDWTIEAFVEEVDAVRTQLGLDRVHLIGHSWGGMLALEYLFTQPAGVQSLVLASALASTKHWCEEGERLRAELPAPIQRAMQRYERTMRSKPPKTTPGKRQHEHQLDKRAKSMSKIVPALSRKTAIRLATAATHVPFLRAPAYEIVTAEYLKKHACRADPFPPEMFKAMVGMNREIYRHMWGPAEFKATGTLKDWDVTSRLGEIDVPTLIVSGRYDEATPAQMEVIQAGIKGSEWVVLEQSSHTAMFEEPELWLDTIASFIDRTEAS
jgi:proline-specific peptidase